MLRASDDMDQHLCLFLARWNRCITLHRPWHHCEEWYVCGSLICISWAHIAVSDNAGFHLSRFLVAPLYVDFAFSPFPGSVKREPVFAIAGAWFRNDRKKRRLCDTSKAFLDPRLFGTWSSYICSASSETSRQNDRRVYTYSTVGSEIQRPLAENVFILHSLLI